MNLSEEKLKLFEKLWKSERQHHRTNSIEPFFPEEFQDRNLFVEYRTWRTEKTDELGLHMMKAMKLPGLA